MTTKPERAADDLCPGCRERRTWNGRMCRRCANVGRKQRLRRIRKRLLKADPTCWHCGAAVSLGTSSVDHLVPRSSGGTDELDNLRVCCHPCNRVKADIPLRYLVCRLQRGTGLIRVWDAESLNLEESAMRKTTFNYAALTDASVRKTAQENAKAIHALLQRTGQAVVETGTRLLAVKEAVGPRVFATWLRAEFEWTESVAVNHMQAARRFAGLDCLERFQPYALYQLCRKATPEGAVTAAIARARAGETITGKKAQDLIREHGGQPIRPAGRLSVSARSGSVETLRTTLQEFAGSLDKLAGKLSRDERDALADEFLKLALQLRSGAAPQPAGTSAAGKGRTRRKAVAV